MTSERHIAVWNNCLNFIRENIDPKQFATWFRPIKPVSLEDATLLVEVPSEFFREYIEDVYLNILKAALKKELGVGAKLRYVTTPVQRAQSLNYPAAHGNTPVNKTISVETYSKSGSPGPFVFPGMQRIQVNPQLNPVYCFENLVVGECNRMGFTAGESISAAPGKTPFNPLFLFGGPGLGKTHLAQAIGIAIKKKYPELVVLYVPASRFKTQFMDAVNVKNKFTDFIAFYQKMDVLIMDDIQDLNGPGTQNAFFSIFNHLHQSGKQLIFTSDRAPADLEHFEARLLSRLKWGLSVELQKPDYATRLAMLRARADREGIQLKEEVLEFLAQRIKSNFRELEGALISLLANATLAHKEITVQLAESITEKIVGEEQNDVTIDKVQRVVCEYFKITRDELRRPASARSFRQDRLRCICQGC